MKCKLIANPVAGRRATEKIRRAEQFLLARGVELDLVLTAARGDAREAAAAAREEGVDRVIAAGGDGTLNEVINGLAPSAIPLAFLPLGTANVFALEAGIPCEVEEACRIALDEAPRPVSLGIAGETRFLLMAGVGFDAEVVYGVDLRLKRRFGKLAYVAGAVGSWLRGSSGSMEIVDEQGQLHSGYGAIIGNTRLYGGKFCFTPEASLIEDRLDILLMRRPGRLALLRCAAAVAAGKCPGPTEAVFLQGRNFTVRGKEIPVQIDGDYLGRLPMTFRAVFGELSLVLPPGFAPERKEK